MPALALWLRIALTIAFIVSGGYCLRRCIAAPGRTRPVDRINDGAHLLMSVVMIAMVWAVAIPDPLGVLIVAFGVAAVWFAVQATGVPMRRAALRVEEDSATSIGAVTVPHQHAIPTRTQCLHHAAQLAAMAWMILVVGRGAAASMPGMATSRTSATVAGLIGGYCLLAAATWAAATWWPQAARWIGPARGRTGVTVSHVTMTAAMGVVLVAMI